MAAGERRRKQTSGTGRLRGPPEQVNKLGDVVEVIEILYQVDHALDAIGGERPVGEGDAIPELCFEQIPSNRMRRIARYAVRRATEYPAVAGTDFDRGARQCG